MVSNTRPTFFLSRNSSLPLIVSILLIWEIQLECAEDKWVSKAQNSVCQKVYNVISYDLFYLLLFNKSVCVGRVKLQLLFNWHRYCCICSLNSILLDCTLDLCTRNTQTFMRSVDHCRLNLFGIGSKSYAF